MQKRKQRARQGSMLVLVTITICAIVVPCLLLLAQLGPCLIGKNHVQASIDAAALLAASEISRIVINDPNLGFVSISNYPAVGTATRTTDGEPSPVLGINTLIGTIRQNTILAKQVQNTEYMSLVDADNGRVQSAITNLNQTLQHSVCEGGMAQDSNGKTIEVHHDVEKFIKQNLPPNMQLDWLTIETGYLTKGGSTNEPAPVDAQAGEVSLEQTINGSYRPYVDIPVSGKHFEFAAAGLTPALVDKRDFSTDANQHLRSVVRVKCSIKLNSPIELGGNKVDHLDFAACGQSYSQPEVGPEGVLLVKVSGQPTSGMQTWRELLRGGQFRDRQVTVSYAYNGDYLLDRTARLRRQPATSTTNSVLTKSFYHWMRNTRTKAKLSSVIAMLDQPITMQKPGVVCYEIAANGTVSQRVLNADPFPQGAVADGQTLSVADTQIGANTNIIMHVTDNVQNLGTIYGGKHAGMPLLAEKIDWCERPEYSGDEQLAKSLGKGKYGTNLVLESATPSPLPFEQQPFNPMSSLFGSLKQTALPMQPRRTNYSGGLAVCIDIGGLKQPDISFDINRMRSMKR